MTMDRHLCLGCLFDADNAPTNSAVTFYSIYIESQTGVRYTLDHLNPSFVTIEHVI